MKSMSCQLVLPEEYSNSKQDEQQLYSFPGRRPGHESLPSSQRKEYLKQVEGHLLQMFGLTSRPKPGKKIPEVHPYLVNLYSNIRSNSNDINKSHLTKRRKVRSVDSRISINGYHNTIRSHDLKGECSDQSKF